MKQRADRSHRGVRHQAPTLIGCLVVKEPQRPALPSLPPRRFRCSRETRLCRAFSVSSTVCRRFFICRQRPFLPRHQPLPPRKPLPTLPWQRASCCEGANISGLPPSAQALSLKRSLLLSNAPEYQPWQLSRRGQLCAGNCPKLPTGGRQKVDSYYEKTQLKETP